MSSKKNKNKAKKAAISALQKAHNEVSPGEEVYMAPTRDPNIKMTRPASLKGKIDDSKFIVMWPHCINQDKSIPQGRRVPLTHTVKNPIVAEMSEVLTYFKLVHVIEPHKLYPRDRDRRNMGRVKVQLVGEVSSGVPLPIKHQASKQAGRQAGKQAGRQANRCSGTEPCGWLDNENVHVSSFFARFFVPQLFLFHATPKLTSAYPISPKSLLHDETKTAFRTELQRILKSRPAERL